MRVVPEYINIRHDNFILITVAKSTLTEVESSVSWLRCFHVESKSKYKDYVTFVEELKRKGKLKKTMRSRR